MALAHLRSLLRNLLHKRCQERDLDDEVRAHELLLADEKIRAGMNPLEAQRQARLELGGVEQVKEQVREIRAGHLLETLCQDIRYGLRMLAKNPGFTAVAVFTLALGIGANTAIFSLIDAVMLRMLHVEQPEALLQVKIENPRLPGAPTGSFTNPLWEQVRAQQDVFSDVFAWSQTRFDLAPGGAVKMVHGLWVSGDFFQGLRLGPVAGRLITASDDHRGCPAIAVLSYGFWKEHYGAANSAIGSTLSLNRHPFRVVGVAPPDFYGIELGDKFDVAGPICAVAVFEGKESRLEHRSHWWLLVAGRIKGGISQAQVIARLKAVSPGIFGAALPENWSHDRQQDFVKRTLTAVPAATGTSQFGFRRRFEQPLKILMAVVALVMIIACANIASLMLARAATRQREIAVRQALGASRLRLIGQLLSECILLSSGGALLGIAFARWGTVVLVRYMSTSSNIIFLDLSPDARVLSFTVTVAVLTAILFGLLPALRSTRVSLTSAMKGSQALEIERPLRLRTRMWIVASQVALSLVLLVAAGLLLRSFAKLASLDIGFDRNNVLLIGTDLKPAKLSQDQQLATYQEIEDRLRVLPGVISVGRSGITPLEGGEWNQTIRTDGSKALTDNEALVWFNSVSAGYFETLRMPLLAGRNFTNGDSKTGPRVAIVNQTFARRFFPGLSPMGRTFRVNQISGQAGAPIEIVGLVKDAKYQSVREDIHPTAFFPEAQQFTESENFELRTVIRPSGLVLPVQAAIANVNKEIPLEFNTLAEQVNDSMVQERVLALLSGFFGTLALLLAMIGLYGTLSYLVSQRQGEFGIRMALGAQPGSILLLVISDVVLILGGGVAAGIGISLATVKVLEGLLFGLSARDAVTLTAAACILSSVAFVAGYLPARRAMRVDPIVALRYE